MHLDKATSQKRDVRRGYMGSTRDGVKERGRPHRCSAVELEMNLGD